MSNFQRTSRFLSQYRLHFIIILGICFYYASSLSTPLLDDEIAAYGIPALKLKENWLSLLPWNYDAHQFFGHPPLNTIYYALVLQISPWEPQGMRLASLGLSLIGVFTFFEIGKTLKSVSLGMFFMLLYLSHFNFWENADLIFADNLFHTLFLLFVMAYLKDMRGWPLILGLGMILTRETALIPLTALGLMEGMKAKRGEKNQVPVFAFLIFAQLSWFLFLFVKTGNSTPIYHNDGFFFNSGFVLGTLKYITFSNFVENFWILTLIFLILGPSKEVFKRHWGFLLISLSLIFGLSTITQSISRYQTIGISAWIIFAGLTLWNRKENFSFLQKGLIALIVGILFVKNISMANGLRNRNKNFQQLTYDCAQKIRNLKLSGKVLVGGWPIYEIVTSFTSLQNFSWPPQSDHAEYLYFDHQSVNVDHDYFAAFDYAQTPQNSLAFKKLKTRADYEPLLDNDVSSPCLIYRKIK